MKAVWGTYDENHSASVKNDDDDDITTLRNVYRGGTGRGLEVRD